MRLHDLKPRPVKGDPHYLTMDELREIGQRAMRAPLTTEEMAVLRAAVRSPLDPAVLEGEEARLAGGLALRGLLRHGCPEAPYRITAEGMEWLVNGGTMPIMEETEEWNGKNVVARRGDYRIAVDDPEDCTYVTAWTADNKRVGTLSTRRTPDKVGKEYLGISLAEVLPKHRGNGLGGAMFRALLTYMAPKWKGISSYLPDQVNKKQIPKIYSRLGGKPHPDSADHMVIDRR